MMCKALSPRMTHGAIRVHGLQVCRHGRRTKFPPEMIRFIRLATASCISRLVSRPTAFSCAAAASRRTPRISCSGRRWRSFNASSSATQIESAANPEWLVWLVTPEWSFLRIQNPDKAGILMHFDSLAEIMLCRTDRKQSARRRNEVCPARFGQFRRDVCLH